MRRASAIAHRCRPSNNGPPSSRLFSIRSLSSLHRPAAGSVAQTVCYPCLARLRLSPTRSSLSPSVPGHHAVVTASPFHSSAADHGPTQERHMRRSSERSQGMRDTAHKPSRMTLSDRVARSGERSSRGNFDEDAAFETGGGMNRRTFTPRPDDKRQFSRETMQRQQEAREAATRPSPSRFLQKPLTDLQIERRAAASRLDSQPTENRSAGRGRASDWGEESGEPGRSSGFEERGARQGPGSRGPSSFDTRGRGDREGRVDYREGGFNSRNGGDREQRFNPRERGSREERFNPRERGSRDERFDPRERGNREERFGAQNRDGRPPPESEGKREFVSPFRDRGPIDPLRAERRQLAADLEQQAAGRANDRYGERFDRRGDNRSSGDFHSDSRPAPNRLAYRPVDGLPGKPVFDSAAKSTHTRPPIRRFAQMKQIASLDHVSSSSREITKEALQRHSAFDTFDFLPQTMSALQKDGLPNLESLTPTPVQSLAIPELISKDPAPPSRASPPKPRSASKPAPGEVDDPDPRAAYQTYLVAAETGSGKTLAYLLPMMDTIKRREMAEQAAKKEETQKRAEAIREPNSRYMYDIESPPVNHGSNIAQPAAVILVPTSELVFQVGALLRKLTYELKLRTEMISRDFSGSMIRRRLFGETRPDIIVGTPFMIDRITEANPEMLARTSYIIVDEADSLFDRSFSPLTSAIIPRAINLEKLVLCSATIPKSLDAYVTRKFPDCKRLVTAGLHAVPRRVQMQIVNVEGEMFRGNKLLACAALLDEIAKDGTEPGYKKRVVVFVNERETTLTVAAYLEGKGFDAVEINRDSDSRRVLETFIGPREEFPEIADGPEGEGEGKTSSVGRRRQGVQVLVTTDLASRGIDTKAVRNVVLYDVPYTSIDFIHRLGRTGRMGRRGRAWVLVDKSSNEEYVKEVKKTMHLGQALI